MNIYKQRVLNIARALRESPNPGDFTMNTVFHDCGTPACAFGHYVSRTDLQDTFRPAPRPWLGPIATFVSTGAHAAYHSPEVAKHFGVDEQELWRMFSGGWGCGSAKTANDAAAWLERVAAEKWPERPTGELVKDLMDKVMGERIPEDA